MYSHYVKLVPWAGADYIVEAIIEGRFENNTPD